MSEPLQFGIVREAQNELANIQRLLEEHTRACPSRCCPDCAVLRAHEARAERQLQLLTGPVTDDMEALF